MSEETRTYLNEHLERIDWPMLLSALADHTASRPGRKRALELLPFNQLEKATESLDETAEMLKCIGHGETIPSYDNVIDINLYLRAASKNQRFDTDSMYECLQAICAIGSCESELATLVSESQNLKRKLADSQIPAEFAGILEDTFNENGKIRDDASPLLRELRHQKEKLLRQIREKLESLLKTTATEEYFQDDYITVREDRLVLPVKANMKGKFDGIVHSTSSSGHTLFIEPKSVIEWNNELKMTLQEERQEITRILKVITDTIKKHISTIKTSYETIIRFDLLLAKSLLSKQLGGSKPKIGTAYIVMSDAHHPLLKLTAKKSVANDIRLLSSKNALVISGPNAGGKTSLLKTIGMNMVLSYAGIFPPVGKNSCWPYFDDVLVDLGDHQNLLEGLSTFSGQVTKLNSILGQASAEKLVLLDELFMNTSASEGAALAQALMEGLLGKKATVICTTHFSPLKLLATQDDRFENASFGLSKTKKEPDFHLMIGMAGDSNAIRIAEKVGMPADIVYRAKELLGPKTLMLSNLEADRERIQEERESLKQLKQHALEEKQKYEDARERLLNEQQTELFEEVREFKKDLADSRKRLRELKHRMKPEKSIGFEKQLNRLKDKIQDHTETISQAKPPPKYEEGDVVSILGSEQEAIVLGTIEGRKQIEVQAGMMRMTLHQDEVHLIGKQETQKAPQKTPAQSKKKRDYSRLSEDVAFTPQSPNNTIDLRGQTGDEAIDKLAIFIDQATLQNQDRLVIVHGHGTGALKTRVRCFLDACAYHLQYRSGRSGEGDDGVTIVEML